MIEATRLHYKDHEAVIRVDNGVWTYFLHKKGNIHPFCSRAGTGLAEDARKAAMRHIDKIAEANNG